MGRADRVPARADARRNRERILDAAADVLGDDPGAGMEAIADRARMSRATLYRHFDSRDEIVDVIRQEALVRGQEIVGELMVPFIEGSAEVSGFEVLERLLRFSVTEDSRYRRLMARDPQRVEELLLLFRPLCDAFVVEGQRRGELDDAVPAATLARALEALVLGAMRDVARGDSDAEDAALTVGMLLRGVTRVPA